MLNKLKLRIVPKEDLAIEGIGYFRGGNIGFKAYVQNNILDISRRYIRYSKEKIVNFKGEVCLLEGSSDLHILLPNELSIENSSPPRIKSGIFMCNEKELLLSRPQRIKYVNAVICKLELKDGDINQWDFQS